MRQLEDNKTLDILQEKRGRGRPPKENALSPAERARRYRERKAEQRALFSRDGVVSVTKNSSDDVWRLQMEIQRLNAEVDSWRAFAMQYAEDIKNAQLQYDNWSVQLEGERKITADLRSLVEMFISSRLTKKGIPSDVFARIVTSFNNL